MKFKFTPRILAMTAGVIITLGFPPATTFAQGTAFTYQGRLNDGAVHRLQLRAGRNPQGLTPGLLVGMGTALCSRFGSIVTRAREHVRPCSPPGR